MLFQNNTFLPLQELTAWSEVWSVTTESGILISPTDGSQSVSLPVTFIWNAITDATIYNIQIANDINFTNIIVNAWTVDTSYETSDLEGLTDYYWRVRGGI